MEAQCVSNQTCLPIQHGMSGPLISNQSNLYIRNVSCKIKTVVSDIFPFFCLALLRLSHLLTTSKHISIKNH